MSNYINKPNYIDTSTHTLIKDIPGILNYNNQENERILTSIFNFSDNTISGKNDSSLYHNTIQYLKVPLITTGLVKGGYGEFANIKFDLIDKNTALNSFKDNVVVDHKLAITRFSDEIDKNTAYISPNIKNKYAHDTGIIYHDGDSLYKTLNNLTTEIKNLNNKISSIINDVESVKDDVNKLYDNLNINKSYNSVEEISTFSLRRSVSKEVNNDLVKTYNDSTNSYTYPAKAYSTTMNIKYKNEYDNLDIKNNKKFRYYNVTGLYTKVNNQYICSLNTDVIGTQTELIIDNTHDNDLIIKLYYDGISYTCVKVLKSDIDLCRLTLTCVNINENGIKWYLSDYSGKIEIIKI